MKTFALSAAVLLATLAPAAHAYDNTGKIYAGVNYTHTQALYQDDVLEELLEENFAGVSPYVGYQLSRGVGVELGYFITEKGNKDSAFSSTDASFSGITLDLVGSAPVTENFKILASVGYGLIMVDAKATAFGVTVEEDDTANAARFGLGAEYEVSQNWGLRTMVNYNLIDGPDLIQYNAGVNYKF